MEMKKYRLADIAEIVISSVDKKTKPGEKIVRLCNFTDVYHNWAIKQSDYDSFMVASASDSNINKLSLKKGFVAFTKDSETRDDIGISTYIADDFDDVVLGYHCALAKPNEKIVYGKYLNAFMSSDYIKKYFELNATGSGMRFTLAVSTMEDMPIMLPSLNVQKKIGDMLSDFDKRIENLRAQNRVLEQTAKTIYDYTFLQCAGHQTTYNKTLNRNIPADWEVKTIGEILDKVSATTKIETKLYQQSGKYPVIDQSTNFIAGYTDDESAVIRKTPAVFFGDHTRIVKMINFEFARGSDGTQILYSKEQNVGPFYLYFAVKAIDLSNMGYARHFKFLKDKPIAIPDKNTSDSFEKAIRPLFDKILINRKQIEALTTQRNTLLPLLMTGQIEV